MIKKKILKYFHFTKGYSKLPCHRKVPPGIYQFDTLVGCLAFSLLSSFELSASLVQYTNIFHSCDKVLM